MKQINWQIEEAIMLIDLYNRATTMTPQEARKEIQKLSEYLRHRAIILGLHIDDTYRNVSGIEMRLKSVNYLVSGGASGLDSPGKSSEIALMLFEKEPEIFCAMLKECLSRYR